jgi:L-fuculose-phosphate aldolase
MCSIAHCLYERGFVVAAEGNLSVRLGADRVLATPTCMSKGMLTPGDLVITDLDGQQKCGSRKVSSELGMHLLIYSLRPDVLAICHAHPPTATGYAAAGLPLNKALLPEVIMLLGQVPLARYGTPGTPEVGAALKPLVPHYDALLMANHGVVTYGQNLLTAFMHMETVEQFAKVTLVTDLLGRRTLLTNQDIGKLLAARSRYGMAQRLDSKQEFPVTHETDDKQIPTSRYSLMNFHQLAANPANKRKL